MCPRVASPQPKPTVLFLTALRKRLEHLYSYPTARATASSCWRRERRATRKYCDPTCMDDEMRVRSIELRAECAAATDAAAAAAAAAALVREVSSPSHSSRCTSPERQRSVANSPDKTRRASQRKGGQTIGYLGAGPWVWRPFDPNNPAHHRTLVPRPETSDYWGRNLKNEGLLGSNLAYRGPNVPRAERIGRSGQLLRPRQALLSPSWSGSPTVSQMGDAQLVTAEGHVTRIGSVTPVSRQSEQRAAEPAAELAPDGGTSARPATGLQPATRPATSQGLPRRPSATSPSSPQPSRAMQRAASMSGLAQSASQRQRANAALVSSLAHQSLSSLSMFNPHRQSAAVRALSPRPISGSPSGAASSSDEQLARAMQLSEQHDLQHEMVGSASPLRPPVYLQPPRASTSSPPQRGGGRPPSSSCGARFPACGWAPVMPAS